MNGILSLICRDGTEKFEFNFTSCAAINYWCFFNSPKSPSKLSEGLKKNLTIELNSTFIY